MNGRARRRAPAVLLSLALVFTAAAARAQQPPQSVRAQCVDLNTRGQGARLEGQLSEARKHFEACTAPRCPALVRKDCAARLEEMERAQPSIIFEVEAPPGAGPVAVTVDGTPSTEALGPSPLVLDPGKHEFVFTLAGKPPITRSLMLHEGVKGRRERVVFEAPPPPAPSPQPPPKPPPPPKPEGPFGPQNRRIFGVAAGGVGIVGVGLGAVFGLLAQSAVSRQKSACASPTDCQDHARAVSEHTTAKTDATISTVAFASGGVLLVGGAALFFTATRREDTREAGVRVAPSIGRDGAALWVHGEF